MMMMIDTIVVGCRIDRRSLLNSNERPPRLIVSYNATRVIIYPKASDPEDTWNSFHFSFHCGQSVQALYSM